MNGSLAAVGRNVNGAQPNVNQNGSNSNPNGSSAGVCAGNGSKSNPQTRTNVNGSLAAVGSNVNGAQANVNRNTDTNGSRSNGNRTSNGSTATVRSGNGNHRGGSRKTKPPTLMPHKLDTSITPNRYNCSTVNVIFVESFGTQPPPMEPPVLNVEWQFDEKKSEYTRFRNMDNRVINEKGQYETVKAGDTIYKRHLRESWQPFIFVKNNGRYNFTTNGTNSQAWIVKDGEGKEVEMQSGWFTNSNKPRTFTFPLYVLCSFGIYIPIWDSLCSQLCSFGFFVF